MAVEDEVGMGGGTLDPATPPDDGYSENDRVRVLNGLVALGRLKKLDNTV